MSNARTKEARTAREAHALTLSARPTSSALAGKCTVPVKTLVTDEVDDDLRRFAARHGYPSVSDCLRELIVVALYGSDYIASLHKNRIKALAQNMAGIGTEGGAE
jgi:hypothetical protein